MNTTVRFPVNKKIASYIDPVEFEDPLDPDMPDDRVIITSHRSLCRVAMVASEVGARFQRETNGIDPMAWMLAPRAMFGGGIALEACLHYEEFIRAILLHGLSLGLDADPSCIDGLLIEDAKQPQSISKDLPRANKRPRKHRFPNRVDNSRGMARRSKQH